MKWHYFTVAAVVAVAGCVSDNSSLVSSDARFSSAPTEAPPPPTTARSQNPDPPPVETVAALSVPKFTVEGQVAVKARAMVNGLPILDAELHQAAYQMLLQTEREPEPQRTAHRTEIIRLELDKLVERELILSEALARLKGKKEALEKLHEAAGKEFEKQVKGMKERARQQGFPVDNEEQFTALLESQGLSMGLLRRQSERAFMAMEFARHHIYGAIEHLGHTEIRQYYDEHPGEFQADDRVKWQDIFLSYYKYPSPGEARKLADSLIARCRAGEDFAELSNKYDDGESGRYRKGAGLGQKHGEIRPPDVEVILFRMREGEIGPIVEMAGGLHIIRLVEREYAGLQPFDEKTQQEIKKKLQNMIAEREYKRFVNELKRTAIVTILNE